MHWQEFSTLFLFCTAMSFSPGPNTTLSTAMAANHGLRSTLPFCLAVPVGWALLMLVCSLGLGAIIQQAPALRWAVKATGIAYMLWLALKLTGLLGQRTASYKLDAQAVKVHFVQGVALQLVNIKAWMLALTLVAGWVATGPNRAARLFIVGLTMMGFAFTSNLSYALLGALLRQWLAHGMRLLWFNRAMASVLLATALWMLKQ